MKFEFGYKFSLKAYKQPEKKCQLRETWHGHVGPDQMLNVPKMAKREFRFKFVHVCL